MAKTIIFFHWELEFAEVFFNKDGSHKENPGFDAVVGNPPYGAELSEQEQNFIKAVFPLCRRNTDTALVFLEHAFAVSQKEGYRSFIVPKSIAYVESWQSLRPLFLPSLKILADASKAFKGVLLEQVVLITGGRPQPTYRAVGLSGAATEFETEIAKADCELIGRLLCDVSSKDREIFERVMACSVSFGELFHSFEGGHWYSELKQSGKIPIYHSRYLQRYYLLEPKAFLDTPPTTDAKKFQKMLGPKLLFQRLVAHVMNPKPHLEVACYYDSEGIIPLKTIEVCLPKQSDYSPYYSLALCNSRLLSQFAYKFIFASAIRGMDFDAAYVSRLPIRRIAFTTLPAERKRLAANARNHYERVLSAGNTDDILDFVETQLTAKRADVIHDLLAFLAERMMKMNKEKQTAATKFLTDLKDFHGIEARALNPKTKLDEFWKLEATELFAHLRKNAKLLATQNIRLTETAEENIRSRFSKAKEKLLPLEAEIAFTDRLIDQIVYRLYGLSDAEIRIVEGTSVTG